MENAINKIEGVESAVISFMAQKLTLVADDERFDEIVAEAEAACRKVDSDCYLEK